MANLIFKEPFNKKYHGVDPQTLIEAGGVADGLNMRKVSEGGGWKARKGCAAFNTTGIESTNTVLSLHRYENPRSFDYHFIAQTGSQLYDSPADPPTPAGGSAWTDLGAGAGRTVSPTTPGFSATVQESFFYADGSGRPLAFSGNTPYPMGFFSYDDSESKDEYLDGTRYVTDKRSDTSALILGAASDFIIIFTNERCEGLNFSLGTAKNSNAVTLTVSAWRSGAWAAVSGMSDGTNGGTGTLEQSGSVTWTRSALDEMKYEAGMIGYAYKLSWSGALSNSVECVALTTTQDMDYISNKWDGLFNSIVGAKFYDQSVPEFQEILGKLGNDSASLYVDIGAATSSDFLYLKTPEPATAFFFGIVNGYANQEDAQILASDLQYWDGDSWENCPNINDQTLDDAGDTSFSGTGVVSFDGSAITPRKRRTFEGDHYPGFWYRVSFDATLTSEVRLYIALYAPFPDTLPTYDGCIEFKGRLFVWGDPEYPNRLRFSSKRSPFCFTGYDSGYTDAFGDMKTVRSVVKLYNELVVFKEDSVWLLEGEDTFTFGVLKITDNIGIASPKTAAAVEVGSQTMHREEPLIIVLWQDTDGIYLFDGRKTKKISMPVDHLFNPEYLTAIEGSKINILQGFIDRFHNEYHLLVPYSATQDPIELVYDYVLDEWYPPWERQVGGTTAYLVTGLGFRGTDDRLYSYAANNTGKVYRLETDTADKDDSEEDVSIEHYIKTRAIAVVQDKGPYAKFHLRHVWPEFKVQPSGYATIEVYKDQATFPQEIDTVSMMKAGFGITTPEVGLSIDDCDCFQVKIHNDNIDQEIEIYSIVYELEQVGLMDI